jgi:hypothetical protein
MNGLTSAVSGGATEYATAYPNRRTLMLIDRRQMPREGFASTSLHARAVPVPERGRRVPARALERVPALIPDLVQRMQESNDSFS